MCCISENISIFHFLDSFPWDQSTLKSFPVNFIYDALAVLSYCSVYALVMAFFISICSYVKYFVDDMAECFQNYDRLITKSDFLGAKEMLIDLVKAHIEIAQFVNE